MRGVYALLEFEQSGDSVAVYWAGSLVARFDLLPGETLLDARERFLASISFRDESALSRNEIERIARREIVAANQRRADALMRSLTADGIGGP